MNLINWNVTKNIDSLGRITLPAILRSRFGMLEGRAVDMYTFEDENGKQYVAFTLSDVQPEKKADHIKKNKKTIIEEE